MADFAPVQVADQKIKKSDDSDTLTITLRKNPDILAGVARLEKKPFVVAFAAETAMVEQNARIKLQKKGADLIVANDVADATIGFDSNENEVLVIGRDGETTRIAKASKSVIANRILDAVVARLR